MAAQTTANPEGKGLKELAASHRGLKSHLTRALNVADRILNQGSLHGPSVILQSELAEAKQDIKTKFLSVVNSFIAMEELDPNEAPQYLAKVEEEHKRVDKMVGAILTMQMDLEEALTPKQPVAAAGGAAPAGRAKPMTSLRPKTLTREATPVEVTQWIKTFTAYFTASQFAEATILEQQAHFRSGLDAHLTSKVDVHITPASPVLPDPTGPDTSCIEYLIEEFLVLKPLFGRRLDYFNYMQQKGQSFTDWYDKLCKRGDEADLPNLGLDDLAAMRMLTGVNDATLKNEFLRSEKKDSKSLLAIAQNYELGQRYVKSMSHPAQPQATAANVNQHQGAKPRSGNNATPAQRVKNFYQDGKCFRCGQKVGNEMQAHKEVCKARDHSCKKCGKVGHFPSVCLSSNSASANQGRGEVAKAKATNAQPQQQNASEKANPPAESANAVRA